ncbi:hypothetical protein ACJJTC_006405 [Scirpophaga incertulas]
MKVLVLLLAVALAQAAELPGTSVYGYLRGSVERLNELRRAPEKPHRIVGGVPAASGQYPHQAGILIDIIGITHGQAVCGGSLISTNRVATSAHCWYDGVNQAWKMNVILGTVQLFNGGTRVETSAIAMHPQWQPRLARNDIAVVYLPNHLPVTDTIAPIALPEGSELEEDFVNVNAIASGFGITSDDGSISEALNHVRLNVIANSACRIAFPLILQESNICTSGIGGVSVCGGDSGGPLMVTRNNRPILIGVSSFTTAAGCEANLPSAYARVTSFIDFLQSNI